MITKTKELLEVTLGGGDVLLLDQGKDTLYVTFECDYSIEVAKKSVKAFFKQLNRSIKFIDSLDEFESLKYTVSMSDTLWINVLLTCDAVTLDCCQTVGDLYIPLSEMSKFQNSILEFMK